MNKTGQRTSRSLGRSRLEIWRRTCNSWTVVQNRLTFTEKDGINYTVFEHAATESKIEFIRNSGICETTPGVDQYSGYLSVGEDMNMWFW